MLCVNYLHIQGSIAYSHLYRHLKYRSKGLLNKCNELNSGQACRPCGESCSPIPGRECFGDLPGDGFVVSPPPQIAEILFSALQHLCFSPFFSGVQGRLPTPRQRKCQGIRSGSQQHPGGRSRSPHHSDHTFCRYVCACIRLRICLFFMTDASGAEESA